ncbi:hypothetical protein HIM_11340 [Hirsutella minnesotensis 3608]|uniref:Uncharacterized protein n=1 Tax=Hirsutella minnesotensis 3608 TaxID=1043627 RepID=A0A0F7ZFJ8_9HYPO|nr:hypothetical protein HIM_11340 [Hirsutella minnesotensis 3608]
MENQERQPARYSARRGPRNEPVRVLFDEAILQALREPQQEPTRIPLDEVRRTLHGLDRQRAEERARRRQGVPQQEATALQPRNRNTIVPIEGIVSTLDDSGPTARRGPGPPEVERYQTGTTANSPGNDRPSSPDAAFPQAPWRTAGRTSDSTALGSRPAPKKTEATA